MGRQIQIYATSLDIRDFLTFLSGKLSIAAVADKSRNPKIRIENSSSIEDNSKSQRWFVLKPSLASQVRVEYSEKLGFWFVDSLCSAVVEFPRCYFDGATLKSSRLYYETGFFEDSGHWKEKSPEFLRWAEALFRHARKFFPYRKDFGACVEPEAWSLHEQGKIRLVSTSISVKRAKS